MERWLFELQGIVQETEEMLDDRAEELEHLGVEVERIRPSAPDPHILEDRYFEWFHDLKFNREYGGMGTPMYLKSYIIRKEAKRLFRKRIKQGLLPANFEDVFYYVIRRLDIADVNYYIEQSDKNQPKKPKDKSNKDKEQ